MSPVKLLMLHKFLAFYYKIPILGRVILAEQIWTDLRNFAEYGATPEQRGKANFDLFM